LGGPRALQGKVGGLVGVGLVRLAIKLSHKVRGAKRLVGLRKGSRAG